MFETESSSRKNKSINAPTRARRNNEPNCVIFGRWDFCQLFKRRLIRERDKLPLTRKQTDARLSDVCGVYGWTLNSVPPPVPAPSPPRELGLQWKHRFCGYKCWPNKSEVELINFTAPQVGKGTFFLAVSVVFNWIYFCLFSLLSGAAEELKWQNVFMGCLHVWWLVKTQRYK